MITTPTSSLIIPPAPVIRFNPGAARDWLLNPINSVVRAAEFNITDDPDATYDHIFDRPSDWLDRMLTSLSGDSSEPSVWDSHYGVKVEVVETCDADGEADGGAVLVVVLPNGIRLATTHITAKDFVTPEWEWRDGEEVSTKPAIDAAVEALAYAAGTVNFLIDTLHRTGSAA
jgi:hypothetical protein